MHDPEFAKQVKGLNVCFEFGPASATLTLDLWGQELLEKVCATLLLDDSCRLVLDDSGQAPPVRCSAGGAHGAPSARCHDDPGVALFDSLRLRDNSVLSGFRGGLETVPPARCPSTLVASQPALQDGIEGVRSARLGTAGGSVGIIA